MSESFSGSFALAELHDFRDSINRLLSLEKRLRKRVGFEVGNEILLNLMRTEIGHLRKSVYERLQTRLFPD